MKSNLEIAKSLYHYFATKNTEAIRAIFAENIEWIQMKGFPYGGVNNGADAIFSNVFSKLREMWPDWKTTIHEFVDAGDSVFAIGTYEGTHKDTGKHMKADLAHRLIFKNGKLVKFVQYVDTHLVAEAAY